jgi:hypothetical protein
MTTIITTRDEAIQAVAESANTAQLSAVVESYLASLGQTEQARGESYGETAARLGGDDVLERAEARWFELGA